MSSLMFSHRVITYNFFFLFLEHMVDCRLYHSKRTPKLNVPLNCGFIFRVINYGQVIEPQSTFHGETFCRYTSFFLVTFRRQTSSLMYQCTSTEIQYIVNTPGDILPSTMYTERHKSLPLRDFIPFLLLFCGFLVFMYFPQHPDAQSPEATKSI